MTPEALTGGFATPATEAAHAARDWYYATIAQEPLISMVGPENHAARKVCERLGAYLERLDIIHGQPVGVWRHPGPEALK